MFKHAYRNVLALALACAACDGLDDGDVRRVNQPGPDGGPDGALGDLSWPVSLDGTPSALRRLTRDELVTTIEALTGSAPARDDLPAEPRTENTPLLTTGLPYIATELTLLSQTIGDFSEKAAPGVLARAGCTLSGSSQRDCLLAWSLTFGQQALRRPVRADEKSFFQSLFATADGTSAADAPSVAAVLRALLFSPSFLYRTELGTPLADKPGVSALGQDELATRLSYFATLGPPDGELLAAAAAGTLGDGANRAKQFERLSHTDAGRRAQAVFLLEWLSSNEPAIRTKSNAYLAGLPGDFEPSTRASVEAAIRSVLESPNPTIANLLSTEVFLNDPAVQAITKASGNTGDTGDTGRAGLLMHPQVLAGHTKEDGLSPFRLGKFVREGLLCEPVGVPPANATTIANGITIPPGATLREGFEARTSSVGDVCKSCHSQFSQFGYALLPFDPVGRWLQHDPSGKPWDLSGTIKTYSGLLEFASPRDLVQKLGADVQVHGCFTQTSLEWALGRKLLQADTTFLVALNDVAKRTGGNVTAILEAIVSAPEFATAVSAR